MLFDPKKLKQQLLQKQKEEENARRIEEGLEPLPIGNNNNTSGNISP